MLKNVITKAFSVATSPLFYEVAGKSSLNKQLCNSFMLKGALCDMNMRNFSTLQTKSENLVSFNTHVATAGGKTQGKLREAIQNSQLEDLLEVGGELFYARRTGAMDSSTFNSLFNQYQKKLKAGLTLLPLRDLCHLSSLLGGAQLGDDELWETLSKRIQFAITDGKLDISDVALFHYGLSQKYDVNEEAFKVLEEECSKKFKLTDTLSIAYLFSVFSKVSQSKGLISPNRENKPADQIESEKVYLQHLSRRLHNAPIDVLLLVGDAMNRLESKSHHIWSILEDRFEELVPSTTPEGVSKFAVMLSYADKGSVSLWKNLEEFFLEAAPYLSAEALSNFIEAFGQKRKGGKYFWNRAEKNIIAKLNEVMPESAVQLVLGFGLAQAGAPKLWNALEAVLCKHVDSLRFENYEAILFAFKGKSWCGDKIWAKIEEIIQSELPEMDLETKAGIYLMMSSYKKLTPEWEELLRDAAYLVEDLVPTGQSRAESMEETEGFADEMERDADYDVLSVEEEGEAVHEDQAIPTEHDVDENTVAEEAEGEAAEGGEAVEEGEAAEVGETAEGEGQKTE